MQLLDLVAEEGGDYEYLDAGDGERLERFGDVVLNRPSPQALWRSLATPSPGASLSIRN